ncbi:MAG: THUMP domain-containing protein [Thermoplasmata archaeon]
MYVKIFYFKNRNELHKKVNELKNYFLKEKGQFIYKDQDNRLLVFSDSYIDGPEAYIFHKYNDMVEILQGIEFKTFAVRSKRKGSMNENRKIGDLLLKNLNEKRVDLENPDITIYVDQVKDFTFFYIKF